MALLAALAGFILFSRSRKRRKIPQPDSVILGDKVEKPGETAGTARLRYPDESTREELGGRLHGE